MVLNLKHIVSFQICYYFLFFAIGFDDENISLKCFCLFSTARDNMNVYIDGQPIECVVSI